VLSDRLLSEKLATAEQLDEIEKKATDTIEKATQFGIDSPWPDVSELHDDVYVQETYSSDVVSSDKATAGKVADLASCGVPTF